jgi:hypothetical protein
MKVGDLVKVRKGDPEGYLIKTGTSGVVIDSLELDDGFTEYEVLFEDGDIGWMSDLMLEIINESG